MGCNTSQEQLQGASSVIENEPNDENNDSGNNCESKQPDGDDNQNVTNREKDAECNAINAGQDTSDNGDKNKTAATDAAVGQQHDNSINGHSNEYVEDKDDGTEKCDMDCQKIKSEMQHSKEVDEEERAATKIQATFRGHRVRASMKQGDKSSSSSSSSSQSTGVAATSSSATKMEKKCEDKKNSTVAAAAVAASNNDDEEPTREQLEAEFDPNDKELCDAAVRIQSAFRSHLRAKPAEIKDDKDLEEITKKVAEELDIDLSDPELNKAATKIQASFRGYRTRKHDDDEEEK